MRQKKTGNRNIWKWLFLLLLAGILGCGIVVTSRMLTRREATSQLQQKEEGETKIGTFSTTREQLNNTVDVYLKEYQTETFSYKIYITNHLVLFEGEYIILGEKIPLYIYFQPNRLDDGSLLLTVSEISAGTLSLPRSEVLYYLRKNYKLPDFIDIDADSASVIIQLTKINNKLGIYAKANTIDLYNDQIIFDIYQKAE